LFVICSYWLIRFSLLSALVHFLMFQIGIIVLYPRQLLHYNIFEYPTRGVRDRVVIVVDYKPLALHHCTVEAPALYDSFMWKDKLVRRKIQLNLKEYRASNEMLLHNLFIFEANVLNDSFNINPFIFTISLMKRR
jgi:hypothetical protein